MSVEVDVATLRGEVKRNREHVDALTRKIDSLDDKVDQLNLSLARFNGVVGVIMILGTVLMAAAKLLLSYFK